MDIWLDTIDDSLVREAESLGILRGVTTNPSLLAEARNPLSAIKKLLEAQNGPVAVQVISTDAEEMIKEGQHLHATHRRIIVKIPAIPEGFQAISKLEKQGIATMATVVTDDSQALLALAARASYIAPYFSYLKNPSQQLQLWQKHIERQALLTRILAASITTLDQIELCWSIGIAAITVKAPLYSEMLAISPLTEQRLEKFSADWNALSLQR